MQSSNRKWFEANSSYINREYTSARSGFEELLKTVGEESKDNCKFNIACCVASTGCYDEALNIFSKIKSNGNDLLYNKALCFYKLNEYQKALDLVDQIIETYNKKHSKLFFDVGDDLLNESEEIREDLASHCIIEGLNLKSAIIFKLGYGLSEARDCLDSIPIKRQELLDCVSLHNQAIYEYEYNGRSSIDKLRFLFESISVELEQYLDVSFRCTVVRNLINILVIYGETEEAIKFLQKTDANLLENSIPPFLRKFYEVYLERGASSSDELVYKKLDKLVEQLLSLKNPEENNELLAIIVSYQGSILWNNNQFHLIERLLEKMKPFLGPSYLWKKNMAHTLFMLDNRFEDCAKLYEELMLKHENVRSVDPLILGNLCISYVLSGRNSYAETLIKDVEADEEKSATDENDASTLIPDKNNREGNEISLLTLINLIIGTLYCVKYNYQFGLARMFKALDPVEKKLTRENWFMVKRCILSMLNCHTRQMVYVKDDLFEQTISFLIESERYGTSVESNFPVVQRQGSDLPENQIQGKQYVSYEARYMRSIILTIFHDN